MSHIAGYEFENVMYGDDPTIKRLMDEYRDFIKEKKQIELRAWRNLEHVAHRQQEISKERSE